MKKRLLYLLFGMLFVSSYAARSQDTLLVGYTEAPPFIYKTEGRLDGLNYRIWESLMEEGAYHYQMVEMPFDQVLEALETGKIDLSIMPISITADRAEKYDFTVPYYTSHDAVAVRNPSPWKKLINAFRGFMNSGFLRGIFLLILIIFIFGYLGWYFEWRDNTEHFRKGLPGLWDGIWWSAVTLTTVGYGDKAPKTVWGRVAGLMLMFGGLLFVSGITASIASSIAINEVSNDFQSLDAFKKVPVGTLEDSQTSKYLKTHFFKDITAYPDLKEGLGALARGEIKGFLYDEEILRSEIVLLDLSGELRVLPIKYNGKFYGFGIRKGRERLGEELSKGILEMRDDTSWQMLLHEYGLSDFN
jgi:ABC-type amino acid transport substrate-binding protein